MPASTLDELQRRLGELSREGSPQIAALAGWVLKRPDEMAFHSMRTLAAKADVNANTVFRLARSLGFDGFDACRRAFQEAVSARNTSYGQRAASLHGADRSTLFASIREASLTNLETALGPDTHDKFERAASLMLEARRVYCAGVRSCYPLAYYLAYAGRMAFQNFSPPLGDPSAIVDAVAHAGPSDVVVAISYSHYSAETVRACELARDCGADVVAVTDDYTSPLAEDAAVVFLAPIAGPQLLPTLGAAQSLVEALLAEMISRSRVAAERVRQFEDRLLACDCYVE